MSPAENDPNYLMGWEKWALVRYAKIVKAALPNAGVVTSGRKADIAYSIVAACQANPRPTR
jgi:hypothetical protein